MLFIRRTEGRGITLFDPRTLCTVDVLEVDAELETVKLQITGEDDTVTLHRGESVSFLQGDASIKLTHFYEYDRWPTAANLGIEAPGSLQIERSEKLEGQGREQIEALYNR